MDLFAPWHIVILVVAFMVLFGARKLPGAAQSLGQAMRIFKSETKGLNQDHDDAQAAPVTPPAAVAGQVATLRPPPRLPRPRRSRSRSTRCSASSARCRRRTPRRGAAQPAQLTRPGHDSAGRSRRPRAHPRAGSPGAQDHQHRRPDAAHRAHQGAAQPGHQDRACAHRRHGRRLVRVPARVALHPGRRTAGRTSRPTCRARRRHRRATASCTSPASSTRSSCGSRSGVHRRRDPVFAGLAVPVLGLHRPRPVRQGAALGVLLRRRLGAAVRARCGVRLLRDDPGPGVPAQPGARQRRRRSSRSPRTSATPWPCC